MIYILMCGGTYNTFEEPRWLIKINGEPIIERTIRLLQELGVNKKDIYISSNLDCFNYLDISIIQREENNYTVTSPTLKGINSNTKGYWVDAFVPLNIPATYICGDVWFSKEALKTIVETDAEDILFFGTHEPYSKFYTKHYDEPLAFKVNNQELFKEKIKEVKYLQDNKLTKRQPISWELYRVIEGLDPNKHVVKNRFVGVHDFALDIDSSEEVQNLEKAVTKYLKSIN